MHINSSFISMITVVITYFNLYYLLAICSWNTCLWEPTESYNQFPKGWCMFTFLGPSFIPTIGSSTGSYRSMRHGFENAINGISFGWYLSDNGWVIERMGCFEKDYLFALH